MNRVRPWAACVFAVLCASPAAATRYQYGARIGPASYDHQLGSSTIYGVHVALPVPVLALAGSVEYVGKNAATFNPGLSCAALGCPSPVTYNFRDVSTRVTLTVPLLRAPGVGETYAGGGLGYHLIRIPSYARPTGDGPPHEFAVGSQVRSSYHALVGGRLGLPATRVGGFAEVRLTWVQTTPVLVQTAAFLGVTLHP